MFVDEVDALLQSGIQQRPVGVQTQSDLSEDHLTETAGQLRSISALVHRAATDEYDFTQPRLEARPPITNASSTTNDQPRNPVLAKRKSETAQLSSNSERIRKGPRQKPSLRDVVKRWILIDRVRRLWPEGQRDGVPQPLCEICQTLDLDVHSFAISSKHVKRLRSGRTMGTLRQIWGRSVKCPLCRLFVKSRWTGILNLEAVCDVKWLLDGRKKVMTAEGDELMINLTRRLSVVWLDDFDNEAHIVLVYPNLTFGPQPLFLGRLLTSIEVPSAHLVKEWYQLCKSRHPDCNVSTSSSLRNLQLESYFGVIDLECMKLSALPDVDIEYAALSYTWGLSSSDVTRFYTTIGNVETLKKTNGIREIEHRLPNTIRDTIHLVKELGIRYLWVDSLCILWDNDEIRRLNSDHMDTIYGHAALTICAADGGDADCGLVALHPTESRYQPRTEQHVEKVKDDLRLMLVYPYEHYISRSSWNMRAWTFQERLLSKRCVVFVDGRVYFECRSTMFSEQIFGESPESAWYLDLLNGSLQQYKKLSDQPVEVYTETVKLYTSRELTVEDDILAAFNGIGKEICGKLNGEQVFGLPSSHFDYALLWQPDRSPERRATKGRLSFPSWSWCGWKDARMVYSRDFVEDISGNVNEWLLSHTWIIWYIRDGQGNLRLVWDPALHEHKATSVAGRWRGYRCQDSPLQDYDARSDLDTYLRPVEDRMKQRASNEFKKTIPKYPFGVRMVPPGKPSISVDHRFDRLGDQRFLQFWTWSARFHLEADGDIDEDSEELIRFSILDSNYSHVGSILLDRSWIGKADSGQGHDFIAISESKSFSEDEMGEWNFVEPVQQSKARWYVYNVLLLEGDDEIKSVSRRAGLGKIYKNGFDTAMPIFDDDRKRKEWKEIILG
ncbi:uncharacterized protein LTR77_005026 [Saxophila tyrrhenica]|uniref:Heterokaryon incompatibility domain-containing protein n=1 Tax=Saxophila tyrrhenica TaxID=1690608 RepID=A0AAV9PF45_9PEZI|nr:hypothetical protein LTR77_005026 [Saxophila tyrrhenica]